jgi:hypothetical protein
MTDGGFDSPLRIRLRTEFSQIGFGAVAVGPEVAALRATMNARLMALAAVLPPRLAAEARATLQGYSGGDGDFFRLFYVPIWSFLHWLPAVGRGVAPDPKVTEAAREAHGLSLFLHLWDDHLCDGQLATDLLRLHLRTTAWHRFSSLSEELGRRVGVGHGVVETHVADYLDSLHHPAPVTDVGAYSRQFCRQIGIWTLTPRLLGQAVGGPEIAAAAVQCIVSFAVAWRLLDDIQDIHQDVMEGKQTAVWLELDDTGRRCWSACRAASGAAGQLDPATWSELAAVVRESGCLQRLLGHVAGHLRSAAATAAAQGWGGMASELEQCRLGLPR